MTRKVRKTRQPANGLRDESIDQPPSLHEQTQQEDPHETRREPNEQVQIHEARGPHSTEFNFIHQSDIAGATSESSVGQKRSRGPTFMKEIWGRPKELPRIEIELNDIGIPISGKTVFSEFLGSLARNGMYCPIDFETWFKVPRKLKMDMLDAIKERFILPLGLEAWTLRSIAKKWRCWKSDLKAIYFDSNLPISEARFRKDVRVREEQWIKIWTYWKSEEAKKLSERNKKARAERTMNHTTRRKSFAQLRNKMVKQLGQPPSRVEMFDKFYTHADGTPSSSMVAENLKRMNELKNNLPSDSQDHVSRNDIFAQVVGQDKYGHVRLFSEGVNPTDLWENVPSRSTCYSVTMQLQSLLSRMEERLQRQDDEIANLKNLVSVQQGRGDTLESSRDSSSASNNLSNHSSVRPIRVGNMVSLKSLFDPTKIVAKGYLRSMNPFDEVGGQALGPNWCEIQIQVALSPSEQLIRPYDLQQTIQDALGAPIAWPCHLVIPTED